MRMKEKAGYAMGRELRAMFPEQTKSIPALLIWTVIYLLDVAFLGWLCFKLGLDLFGGSYNARMIWIGLLLIAALGIFWVETKVYNKIVSLFR